MTPLATAKYFVTFLQTLDRGVFYLLGNGIEEYVDILAVAKGELFPHVEPCKDPGAEEQEGWEDDDECEEGHPGVPGEGQEDGPDATDVATGVGNEDGVPGGRQL